MKSDALERMAAGLLLSRSMRFHLAQLNIGRVLHPLYDPRLADFVGALDRINRLAEESAGFVWRLQSNSGNATDVQHPWSSDPCLLVNMSVWESPEHLKEYVYRTEHLEFFLRRQEWFERLTQPHSVLWRVPAGHLPDLEEARQRLEHYRDHGPTPLAFWFSRLFPPPVA